MDVEELRKGGDVVEFPGGGLGGGEKASLEMSVSKLRMASRDLMWSQDGGAMLARRCFFRRRASQRGMSVLCGGTSWGVGPYGWSILRS